MDKELQEAYEAGMSCAKYGANTFNCNFRHFSTVEKKEAWEKGNKDFKGTVKVDLIQ